MKVRPQKQVRMNMSMKDRRDTNANMKNMRDMKKNMENMQERAKKLVPGFPLAEHTMKSEKEYG